MKKSLFILIVLSTLSLSLSQTPPPVRDTDGNIVRSGTNYYIQPVVNDKGGGVTLAPLWHFEYGEDGIRYVSSHGMLGSPGRDTLQNWFKIEKFENDYKIVYCPSVVKNYRPYCSDIGSRIAKNGRRTLVLNNAPLKVKFKKA
nr:hypothetical protein [Tanacetum cinerariifolium]